MWLVKKSYLISSFGINYENRCCNIEYSSTLVSYRPPLNASCHVSGTSALTKLNPDLKSMAEEEDFSKAQPFLFGSGFEQKTKEHTEALKCLHKVTTKQTYEHPKKFFLGDCPHQSGGSGGGNSYRQKNYQSSY